MENLIKFGNLLPTQKKINTRLVAGVFHWSVSKIETKPFIYIMIIGRNLNSITAFTLATELLHITSSNNGKFIFPAVN